MKSSKSYIWGFYLNSWPQKLLNGLAWSKINFFLLLHPIFSNFCQLGSYKSQICSWKWPKKSKNQLVHFRSVLATRNGSVNKNYIFIPNGGYFPWYCSVVFVCSMYSTVIFSQFKNQKQSQNTLYYISHLKDQHCCTVPIFNSL